MKGRPKGKGKGISGKQTPTSEEPLSEEDPMEVEDPVDRIRKQAEQLTWEDQERKAGRCQIRPPPRPHYKDLEWTERRQLALRWEGENLLRPRGFHGSVVKTARKYGLLVDLGDLEQIYIARVAGRISKEEALAFDAKTMDLSVLDQAMEEPKSVPGHESPGPRGGAGRGAPAPLTD